MQGIIFADVIETIDLIMNSLINHDLIEGHYDSGDRADHSEAKLDHDRILSITSWAL